MTAPWWARWLLSRLCPEARQEEILGDLEEVHRGRVARHGRGAAWLLTSLEAAGLSLSLARGAVRLYLRRDVVTGVEARLALRLLARTPVLSVTAVTALTVGIALATTGFTVVRSLLDPRLPFPQGERVVEVEFRDARTHAGVSVPLDFAKELGARSSTLLSLGAVRDEELNLVSADGEIELVPAAVVQPGAFPYVPMTPVAGRALEPADGYGEVAHAVVMVSEGLWTRRFGRAESAIGGRVSVGGVEHQIVGVVPSDVSFPSRADLWLPLAEGEAGPSWGADQETRFYALLAPGSEPSSAQAELTALAAVRTERRPELGQVQVRVRRVGELQGAGLQGGVVVAALVGLLLVIAGNVGNLMVARAAARRPELSIRAALGASRARLVTQLSLEALVLTAMASAWGLWISRSALSRFVASEAADLPAWLDLRLHVGVAAFVVLIAAMVTAVAGVGPALGATRVRGGTGSGGTRAFGWFHDSMIVAQIALSVGVLGAAVMVHQGWLQRADPGASSALPAGSIVAAQIDLPPMAGSGGLRAELEAAVGALGGVVAVGTSTFLPGADAPLRPFEVESTTGEAPPLRLTVPVAQVSRGFFAVAQIEAEAGRLFDDADYAVASPRVALVNEAFVRQQLAGANAVGRRIRPARSGDDVPPWYEIVGVVGGPPLSANDPDRAGGAYLPLGDASAFRLLARTDGSPSTLALRLQPAVFSVDPTVAVSGIRVLSDVLHALRRLYLLIGSAFTSLGAVVLLLSLMGIYSVLSFEVTRRTREIGVRVALGAGTTDVLRPVLGRVAAYAALGGALGTVLGLTLVRLAQAMFVMRFPPTGARTFVILVVGALVAALVAAWMPTRRALAIHPADALRAE